ncbi:prolyl 4-hydroxylase subunit alpha-3 isoform X2 [Melanerpes formicivorus]|uniref:prolyl 4-hydroxylase subunit alpha-3 isoform X2 n=1 Tax=Melanerpes formicivorus TaxID=211600 RepID=UPI00358EAAC6
MRALGPPGSLALGVLMSLLRPPPAPAETYSAMASVRGALGTEARLLRRLRTYLGRENARLQRLARFYERIKALHQDPQASVDNPLLAFSLIKRLHSDWPNVVYSEEASENIQVLQEAFQEVEEELPGAEDLAGAARGLMRLQDVYGLSAKAMARGSLQPAAPGWPPLARPGPPFPLSAADCFHVGKVAYDTGDFYHSIPWLEEAAGLFRLSYGRWHPEDGSSLEAALDHLAFSYFMAGNISQALSLSKEFLLYEPSNQRVVRNVAKYQELLEVGLEAKAVPLARPNGTQLRSRDAYEQLCQRPGGQPYLGIPPGLSCSYETNGSPYLLLQPAKKEVVQVQPYLVLYHDFITDLEAETIKGLAGPWLQRSVVASGEQQQKAEYRISKSAWLKATAAPAVVALEQRISALTGLDLRPPYAEHLQVVNYGLGGHYEPHFDHATSMKSPLYRMKSGNRIATVMIYLSAVQAGGSTAFIYANLSVPVVKNAALFWWNLRRSGAGDGDTLHAACPVLAGDKWVANKWIHEHGQEFRRRCGADPRD